MLVAGVVLRQILEESPALEELAAAEMVVGQMLPDPTEQQIPVAAEVAVVIMAHQQQQVAPAAVVLSLSRLTKQGEA